MSRPIIEVKSLSKVYQLGAIGATSLRDEIERFWQRLHGKSAARPKEDFWALRDVSFNVLPGEVLGIIGRNGAGKSTLLKILSRITQQTSGKITLRGRIASLLEVGTGFHPDLSGRENIFLNGAILGMSKAEIRKKFDEIVDFSGVEEFIDTPVKRYSSGMYVRLAFAVAAHLEPEILIVDEVLAVGDAEFQKKCLGKMRAVSASDGRTVIFVSHNMQAIRQLCGRCIWLQNGKVLAEGTGEDITMRYISSATSAEGAMTVCRKPEGQSRILHVMLQNSADRPISVASVFEPFRICVHYEMSEVRRNHRVCVDVFTQDGSLLAETTSEDGLKGMPLPARPGTYKAVVEFPAQLLAQGEYILEASLDEPGTEVIDQTGPLLRLRLEGNPFPRGRRHTGIMIYPFRWNISEAPEMQDQIWKTANGIGQLA